MTKQILFTQGAGAGAHGEDQTLVDNLQERLGAGYDVHYPKMPKEDNPEYPLWRDQLAEELAGLEGEVILVGHSAGASVLLRYLVEEKVGQPIRGLFLLATPYLSEEDWQIEAHTLERDFAANLPETVPLFFYHSRGDEIVPFSHLGLYRDALQQATFRELSKQDEYGGHQFGNDLTEVAEDIKSLAREETRSWQTQP